jgi:hypothetical protein
MNSPTEETDAQLSEIRRLVDRYALAMDGADLAVFAELFVPEGKLLVRDSDRRLLGAFEGPGPDGVGLIAQLLAKLYASTLHHITTHVATIDGDRAAGSTYCLAYHVVAGADGGALETLGVSYREQFVKTPSGWRFDVRDATRVWSQITPTPRSPLLIDHAAAEAR